MERWCLRDVVNETETVIIWTEVLKNVTSIIFLQLASIKSDVLNSKKKKQRSQSFSKKNMSTVIFVNYIYIFLNQY